MGCRLRRSATQSINSASSTAISWDTEDEDLGGFITVTSTTVTIPTGQSGLYAITCRAVYTASMSGRCFIEIAPTSTIPSMPAQFRNPSRDTEDEYAIGITIPLLAGDTFLSRVFQSAGAARNVTAWLSCYRVGPFS
jgi:hypothetical protein